MTGLTIAIVTAALLGAALVFVWLDRRRLARALHDTTARLDEAASRVATLSADAAALRARADDFEARQRELIDQREALDARFREGIKAVAADVLKDTNKEALTLMKTAFATEQVRAIGDLDRKQQAVDALVKPIRETLAKTDEKLAALEKERTAAYTGVLEQVRAMQETGRRLDARTADLVAALRKPQVRGRYGEIQLERVIELAGMRTYCDFATQESARDDAGRLLRPDAVVRLPNERCLAIDAKTNIEAYLDAIEAATPEQAEERLEAFARHVSDQAAALSKKEYWSRFEGSPEFVVMFIPGDQFIDAALQRRPDLLDLASQRGVVLASPSTLIGLLRAVHVGWREKGLSDSANELFALGKTLHERAANAFEHVNSLGAALRRAVDTFNKLVGSTDQMLAPAIRRFEDAGAKSAKELPAPEPIEVVVRETRAFAQVSGAQPGAGASQPGAEE